MLYNGLMRERKRWSVLALMVGVVACGRPKQAQFVVAECAAEARATAPEFWQFKGDRKPVGGRGGGGGWDSVDLLNPSVVRWNGRFYNLYSGYDGRAWRTGLATSSDGRNWKKFDGNPVLSPLAATWEGEYI